MKSAIVESAETAQDMVGEEDECLTTCGPISFANYEYLILMLDKYCHNHNSRIVVSNTKMETVFSDFIYSEYSLPSSETNVEIEFDVIAEASPLSTAVSGSVLWYNMPRFETEVEIPPTLYVGGIRVVDSIECLHRLPSAELRPVENFDNLNDELICADCNFKSSF
ncbi:hypothetical protein KIN20_013776 [Parelaphostrongylus tenuis]|uniref:Uncharacterized protein n=1 Tax=Parelaphostrongylus tenuis TaxID=148309 RepID=A0AAD5QR99_PARTN|nr:hypothetical protein KIN20_013776 [Parelaphostrongylus tenuis]